jgi:hypothetical protein
MTMTSPIARDQDAIADESDERAGPQPAARWGLANRCATVLQNEMTLIVVLVGSFFGRWMVADRKSYWLDEILSVTVYGVDNDNVIEAVRRLAQGSVHPPLYQATLYVWMELFGTSERATRSLSNLYITLATLFLFLLLRTAFSRGVALMSAIAFTLMYTATYYGLETRSYAQTIFLVTLSSYALLLLARAGKARGWRPALRSPVPLLFLAANVGLLLTHYYNVFFWAAQALIVAVYVLREWPPRRWPLALGVAAALYALQAAIFLAVWGKVLYRTYERRSDAFAVEGAVRSPWELAESVITPNIDPPWWLRWLGLAVAAVMIGRAVVVLARRRTDSAAADSAAADDAAADSAEADEAAADERREAWTIAYLVGWLLAPVFTAYVAFVVTGVARYSPRYWLFIVPALAPLVVLTVREAVRLVGRALRREPHPAWWVATSLVLVATLILPGTHAAATSGLSNTDWRGTARDIVSIVHSNPDARYVIFETSFSKPPYLDFYLDRFADDVHVTATIRRRAEAGNEESSIDRLAPEIRQSDFIIVVFIHHGVQDYPRTLAKLDATYHRYQTQVDEIGRGLVIYSVAPTGSPR